MANWQDPQTTGVNRATVSVPSAARDVGLRSYMLKVYNYMASGVLLTGIVALLFAPYAGRSAHAERPACRRSAGSSRCRRSPSCSR